MSLYETLGKDIEHNFVNDVLDQIKKEKNPQALQKKLQTKEMLIMVIMMMISLLLMKRMVMIMDPEIDFNFIK